MQEEEEDPIKEEQRKELKSEKQALSSYAKYTGVAFQMMGIIAVSAFIGYKIDQYYDHQTQWVTAITSVFGVVASIYQVIRQLK